MLAGAMETVSGTEDSASSLTSTSGGLASTLAASGLGPVICHIFASPNNWTPFTCKFSDCGSSVGLTIAIVRNLRSLLNAAETSNGYVGLPGLVAGCSPPTGHLGADCGELPLTSTGTVPKWSLKSLNINPVVLKLDSVALKLIVETPMVKADILMKSVCRNISCRTMA